MAQVKFTKTQEKQYNAWVTLPGIGVRVPGVNMVTDNANRAIIATPLGMRVISLAELARDFLFKGENGTELIMQQSLNARASGGILPWTEVVRNTASVHDVMARHIPGKQYGNLGVFEFYPEMMGQQYAGKMRGDAFVRMYNLKGGLANIASVEQARAVTQKPSSELAKIPVAPVVAASLQKNGVSANSPAALLEAQLRQTADNLRKVNGTTVRVTSVKKDKDGAGKVFYRGDIEYKFPITTSGKQVVGALSIPVAVAETSPNKAVFSLLTRGDGYGVAPATPAKNAVDLAGLQQSLVSAIQNRALQIRDAYNASAASSKLLSAITQACDALNQKVVQMKYAKFDRHGGDAGYSISAKHKNVLFGDVACVVYSSEAGNKVRYHCNFTAPDTDTSYAAKALAAGSVPATSVKEDTRSLASAIVSGFAKLKKDGDKLRASESSVAGKEKAKKDNFVFRVVGRGRSASGEQLYVMERIASGARTTMTRNQLLKALGWDDKLLKRTSENLVENMYARKYQNTTQLRMRGGGGLDEMDVGDFRRSFVNKVEGAKSEATQLYNEVIRALTKKNFTASGDVEISDEEPIGGTFSVTTPDGATIKAMYSVSMWRYGATDGGQVKLSGTVPEDQRRRSMLASSLVSLILTAAKSAKASSHNPAAPIVPASDDDFTDAPSEEVDSDFDELEEAGENTTATFGGDTGIDADFIPHAEEYDKIDPSDVDGTDAGIVDGDFADLPEASAVAEPTSSLVDQLLTTCKTSASIINDKANSVNDKSSVAILESVLGEINGNKETFDGAFESLSDLLNSSALGANDKALMSKFNEASVCDKAIEACVEQIERYLKDAREAERDLADATKLYDDAFSAYDEVDGLIEGLDTTQSVVVDDAIGQIAGYKSQIENAAVVASPTLIAAGETAKANELAKLSTKIGQVMQQLQTDYENAVAAEEDAKVEAKANAEAEAKISKSIQGVYGDLVSLSNEVAAAAGSVDLNSLSSVNDALASLTPKHGQFIKKIAELRKLLSEGAGSMFVQNNNNGAAIEADIQGREKGMENLFEGLQEAKNKLEDAAVKAAEAESEADPFAGLGDDIDAIFNALPDHRQNP